MGSQAMHDARVAAPLFIVVKTRGTWRIAKRGNATQWDKTGGGRGFVSITYILTGRPYASEAEAAGGAWRNAGAKRLHGNQWPDEQREA